jgi:hypothetical protein
METIPTLVFPFFPALLAINFGVIIPLALSCLVLVVVIPSAAWRGRMNVPFYALLLFVSAFVAFGTAKVAGAPSIHGTTLGVVITFISFLLVAGAVGSFLGILFYRQRIDDSTPNPGETTVRTTLPVMDEDRH